MRAPRPLALFIPDAGAFWHRYRLNGLPAGLVALLLLTAGCATTERPDPLESLNRKTFAVNEALDKAVLEPVARGYARAVPRPVRTGVGNFFSNTRDAWSAANLFMQGRPAEGASDVMRFGTNTVFGVLGVFDVASGLGMEKHGEDFGRTLGHWGLGPGAYVVLPLLGPSSVRDTVAMPLDSAAGLLGGVDDVALGNTLTALQLTATRADLLPVTDMVDQIALDKYLFVRDAYLQRRQNQIDRNDRSADSPQQPADDSASAPLPYP